MTIQTLEAVTKNLAVPSFVPPVNLFQLGRQLFRNGFIPQSDWCEKMRDGWNFEGQRAYRQAMMEDGQ